MRTAPLLLLCAVLGLAPSPSPAAEGDQLESSQIRLDDRLVTIYTLRGQSYRFTDPDALGDQALAGQLVCIEGKLRELRGTELTLFGTDRKIPVGNAETFKAFSPGDNLWLGGRVTSGTFTAHAAVKLRTDLALFDERFATATKDKSWERMLDLAAWISRSATYNPGIAFEEHRRYRASRDRAVTAACSIADATFKDSDAAGYSRLALRLLDLEVDRELVWRYFRQAALIDPDQAVACRRLAEAGYIRWHGQWLTRTQKEEREAEENSRTARNRDMRAAREQRRAEEAASGIAVYARETAELEVALAGLPPSDASARLASTLERASSPRLGRRIICLAAGLPAKHQAAVIATAFKSRDPEVRCAALELSAIQNDAAARAQITQAAVADSSEEVVELACRLLATAGDAQALGSLVELTASDKDFRARAAVEALQKAADQDRWTPVEWRLWWAKNKPAYPQGPRS